jgi:hypothetical protein
MKIPILEAECVQYYVESEAEDATEHRSFNSSISRQMAAL